jgi:hypothetical protein
MGSDPVQFAFTLSTTPAIGAGKRILAIAEFDHVNASASIWKMRLKLASI